MTLAKAKTNQRVRWGRLTALILGSFSSPCASGNTSEARRHSRSQGQGQIGIGPPSPSPVSCHLRFKSLCLAFVCSLNTLEDKLSELQLGGAGDDPQQAQVGMYGMVLT